MAADVNVTLDFGDAILVGKPSFFGIDRLAANGADDDRGLPEEHGTLRVDGSPLWGSWKRTVSHFARRRQGRSADVETAPGRFRLFLADHGDCARFGFVVGGIDGNDRDIAGDTVVTLHLRGGLADDDRAQLAVDVHVIADK